MHCICIDTTNFLETDIIDSWLKSNRLLKLALVIPIIENIDLKSIIQKNRNSRKITCSV